MKRRKLFKNGLITLLLALSSNLAFADSYIMVSPEQISKVECQNENIVGINLLSTLMNERKSIVITSLSDGNTTFTIKLKHKKCDYKVSVKDGKMTIKGDRYIKILPVDLPPELIIKEDCE